MSEGAGKGARPRQAGAIEVALRQLEERRAAEGGEGSSGGVLARPGLGSSSPEGRRPVLYPKKGPGSVPPECCRPWAMADRGEAEFEHLDDLALSLASDGQLQPAIVRPVVDAVEPQIRYEVIAGNARWRAAMKAGVLLDIVVHPGLDDEAAFRMMVGENEFRRGLSDFSRAKRFAAALARGLYRSKGEMAERLRLSPAQLSYFLGFAELDPRVVARVRDIGKVSVRLGYVMNQAARSGHVERLLAALPRIEAGELGRSDIEAWLKGEGGSGAVDGLTSASAAQAKSSQREKAVVVNAASGAPLFEYSASSRRGVAVQIPVAVAGRLDESFWTELAGLLERRLG